MCIFMTIQKEDLESILETYPTQGKFLRAVGRQRLLTTNPADLQGYDENLFEVDDGENVFVDNIDDAEADIGSEGFQKLEKKISQVFSSPGAVASIGIERVDESINGENKKPLATGVSIQNSPGIESMTKDQNMGSISSSSPKMKTMQRQPNGQL